MSICGGDPLVHPDVNEIVRMSKDMGWKPIINTNGLSLTKKRLRALKEAGVFGFSFHIDTSQARSKIKRFYTLGEQDEFAFCCPGLEVFMRSNHGGERIFCDFRKANDSIFQHPSK